MRALVESAPDGPIDGRFIDLIEMALRESDQGCFGDQFCRQRMEDVVKQGISRLLTQRVRRAEARQRQIELVRGRAS